MLFPFSNAATHENNLAVTFNVEMSSPDMISSIKLPALTGLLVAITLISNIINHWTEIDYCSAQIQYSIFIHFK